MATALDVSDIDGHQSMAHTPGSERDHLVETRTHSLSILVEKIKNLKDTIANKDELLLGYQQNLARLTSVVMSLFYQDLIAWINET